MRYLSLLILLFAANIAGAEEPWQQPNDASPAFAPGGAFVVFSRGDGAERHLYLADREGEDWTAARIAPFSHGWMDLEPAMAPDGSYLVFASNRPAQAGGEAIDGFFAGKPRPKRGGNLWRVAHDAQGWGEPQRLPATINDGNAIFSPAVAADGSLYFMKPDAATGKFRLYVSRQKNGMYDAPMALSFSDGTAGDFDPAVAPDQSFMVFSSARAPSTSKGSALFITYATADGWTAPQPLGPLGIEARLSPDLATLYYNGPDQRIHQLSLAQWRQQHPRTDMHGASP